MDYLTIKVPTTRDAHYVKIDILEALLEAGLDVSGARVEGQDVVLEILTSHEVLHAYLDSIDRVVATLGLTVEEKHYGDRLH